MSLIPLLAEISPCRVHRDDESNLLDSQPAFDLLFALDRVVNILKAFEVSEAIEFVFRGEAGSSAHFVFAHSTDEIVCNSRIECFEPVSHDVDEVCFRWLHTW